MLYCSSRVSYAALQHPTTTIQTRPDCVKIFLSFVRCNIARDLMKSSSVLIKKYGNRRLYDTAASRYVNLDGIAALIREGKEVQVVDAKSGRDLTRLTLTQIITEDAKNKPTGLPLELLRQLIVASDQVRQEFIMWYLKSAFDTYQKVQEAVESRLGEVQSVVLSPVAMMKKLLSGPGPRPATPAEQELDNLRRRVAELEASSGKGTRRQKR